MSAQIVETTQITALEHEYITVIDEFSDEVVDADVIIESFVLVVVFVAFGSVAGVVSKFVVFSDNIKLSTFKMSLG